jgi:osmotically-inducible protein OsmY
MKTNYLKALTVVAVAFLATSMSVGASEIDDKTVSSAKNSYVFKTYLTGDNVKVSSKEGEVTLSGTVNQDSHKSLAQETVANLPGVTSVDNRLELKGEHPSESSNEWIALKVNTMLVLNRNVSPLNTKVYVEEGIVTLRGEADNEAQRDLITEYVKDINGIEGVKNEMTVAKASKKADRSIKEKIDDASITAQVKMALMSHRSTSVRGTKVATKDGIVTLTGIAKNGSEKDLVTKFVGDIHGVNSVVNKMMI